MSLETILQLVISSTLVYSAPLIFTALGVRSQNVLELLTLG